MDLSILENYGIAYKKGLERCLGDESFYAMLLEMFLEDDAFRRAKDAYERGDGATLFDCAHELKGVSGNIELSRLYDSVCGIVESLRDGRTITPEVGSLFETMEKEYMAARNGVAEALGK